MSANTSTLINNAHMCFYLTIFYALTLVSVATQGYDKTWQFSFCQQVLQVCTHPDGMKMRDTCQNLKSLYKP